MFENIHAPSFGSASKLVAMVKGSEDGSGAEGRRVDIFEHK